jgi:hypothetical protein
MIAPQALYRIGSEEFLARLTTAAYRAALRHGLKGPFIDVELDIWRELRAVLREELTAGNVSAEAEAPPRKPLRPSLAPCEATP